MSKKKPYNNPYYLEMLKALVARKATKGARNTIPIEDLRYLSNELFKSEYLLKVMPVNGVTKSTAYTLKEPTLNTLVDYIKNYVSIYEKCNTYNDFIAIEYCNFANQFDGFKSFFDYSQEVKNEVYQKVEERINEILGRSNKSKNVNNTNNDVIWSTLQNLCDCFIERQSIKLDDLLLRSQFILDNYIKKDKRKLAAKHLELLNLLLPKICMGCGRGYDVACCIAPLYEEAIKVETTEKSIIQITNNLASKYIIDKEKEKAKVLLFQKLPSVQKNIELKISLLKTAQHIDHSNLSFTKAKLEAVKEFYGTKFCLDFVESLRCSICISVYHNHPDTKVKITEARDILPKIDTQLQSNYEEVVNANIWLEHLELVYDFNQVKYCLSENNKQELINRVNALFVMLPRYSDGFRPEQKSFLHKILFYCLKDKETKLYNLYEAQSLMQHKKAKYTCVFDFEGHEKELDTLLSRFNTSK